MINKKKVVFWGASGQAIVLEDTLQSNKYKLVAIFDNNDSVSSPFYKLPIYYGEKGFVHWLSQIRKPELYYFAVAIGGDNGFQRLKMYDYLKKSKLKPLNIIHNSAVISSSSLEFCGVQILANVVIAPRVKIGEGVIINNSVNIDHECIIHDGVHIAPGATLAGCIEIGKSSFIGTGATILPRIKIGKNVTIGAASFVNRDIPDNVVAYGVPAKIIREKETCNE